MASIDERGWSRIDEGDKWRRLTVGSRIGRNGYWIGKLLREANGIWGVFGAALEEMRASFCSGQRRI